MKKKIEKLLKEAKKYRADLPEFSMFGTNNWKNLDIQIKIYKGILASPILKDGIDDAKFELEEQVEEIEEEFDDEGQEEIYNKTEPLNNIINELENLS